ncbi:DUF4214 domain-containing protein [Pseudoflavitalea sp. X16]|uniref:DUF4214 domain-containing protein n=1 Tax=Paraflavitalea devenefica TaxID=2716334 RepID=UPI001421B090|nr:DUF4214 domain-containing protein [Paraflavitalea devenefica]NII27327.1 DUF4214 domain-containing protein [Paraflavitalea devenefica]
MSPLFHRTLFTFAIGATLLLGCRKSFNTQLPETSLGEKQFNSSFSTLDMPEYLTEEYNLPIRVDSNFKWGVSGHPLTQEPYLNNHALQADLIKELNASYYRIDISHNADGEVNNLSYFNAIITQTAAKNIQLIPIIFPPDTATLYSYTVSEAETKGYLLGKGFASRYKQYFNYYQLGNEEDSKLLPTVSTPAGTLISDYSRTDRVPIWLSFLRGMITGVKEEDPTAKTIVTNGGWYHYGYFLLLDSAGIDYDILGYHWYSGIPDYLNILNTLQTTFASKEVWFTEVNVQDSTILVTPTLHRKRIEDLISHLDQRSNVKAFFIYELFDEDQHFDPDEPNIEDIFGLIDWTVPYVYTNFTYKEGYKMYKFKIEETKHGFEDFIYSLYTFANHRAPDPGGLTYWTNRLASSRDVPAIVNEFLGVEFYGAFVEEQYQLLLDRVADPTGKTYWTNRLMTDMSRENVIATFCSDTEFWTLSGSTNSGFIDRAFQKLFDRAPASADVTYWTQRLTTGTTRMTMIEEMIHNEEYLHIFVRAQYNFLLRRNGNVDPVSENWAVGLMQDGMTQRGFIKTLFYSKEFWERGVQEGYVRNNPPYQF